MKLIVGLGNPGAEHASNRHNIGFMVADAIASTHGFGPWRNKFQGQLSEGKIGTEKCLLLKPSTYMNESGRAAAEAVRFYKLDLDDVIVLHDELDLAPAKIRVKTGGGVAGHNGLKSLTRHLGNDYVRVRIGIGHPGSKEKVHGHVLKNFSKDEMSWVTPLVDAIAQATGKLVDGEASSFMNAVTLATGEEKQAPKKQTRKSDKSPKGHPSQRDLARGAAKPATQNKPEPDQKSDGPFARLQNLFSGTTKKDQ